MFKFNIEETTKSWLKETALKAVTAMAQTFVATIGPAAVMGDVNWQLVASASLLSGILSAAAAVAGTAKRSAK